MGVFDSSNEAAGRTDCNTKDLSSLCCTVAEKIAKTQKITIFSKMTIFMGISWFFQQRYIAKSWGFLLCNQCFLALHLSYQTPHQMILIFWLIIIFLKFVDPLKGIQNSFWKFWKLFLVFFYDKMNLKAAAPEFVWNIPPYNCLLSTFYCWLLPAHCRLLIVNCWEFEISCVGWLTVYHLVSHNLYLNNATNSVASKKTWIFNDQDDQVYKKLAAQAAGADPSRLSSTYRSNPPLQ